MGLLVKRAGLGTFVAPGARDALSSDERKRFFDEELPAFAARLRVLNISLEEVEHSLRDLQGKGNADHH
jgi:GntR family transcriptional regulator